MALSQARRVLLQAPCCWEHMIKSAWLYLPGFFIPRTPSSPTADKTRRRSTPCSTAPLLRAPSQKRGVRRLWRTEHENNPQFCRGVSPDNEKATDGTSATTIGKNTRGTWKLSRRLFDLGQSRPTSFDPHSRHSRIIDSSLGEMYPKIASILMCSSLSAVRLLCCCCITPAQRRPMQFTFFSVRLCSGLLLYAVSVQIRPGVHVCRSIVESVPCDIETLRDYSKYTIRLLQCLYVCICSTATTGLHPKCKCILGNTIAIITRTLQRDFMLLILCSTAVARKNMMRTQNNSEFGTLIHLSVLFSHRILLSKSTNKQSACSFALSTCTAGSQAIPRCRLEP